MRVLPSLRVVVAALAAGSLIAAPAVSLAPAAPAGEPDGDPRFVVVGSAALPLVASGTVVVNLDGLERATALAALLDEDASALDLAALLRADGDLQALVDGVRAADAVVVVSRDHDAGLDDAAHDGVSHDGVSHDEGSVHDDDASDGEGSVRVEGDACRAEVATWLAALGTPAVVVTDVVPDLDAHNGEEAPSGETATSSGANPYEGADVVYVLDPTVTDQDVAAVLTGKSVATGQLPERARTDGGDEADEPVKCPELPEAAPAPGPDPTDAPSEPVPEPTPSPEPAPDAPSDPAPGPDPTSPDDDGPGTVTPDAPDTYPDHPKGDTPDAGAPEADEPVADGPGVPAPRIPEIDGPQAPGPPGSPPPGPPPEPRTPALDTFREHPHRTPWRLPTFKPTGDPLVLSVAPGGLDLSDVKIDGDLIRLSGVLPGVTVVDHRKSKARGWTLSAQVSDLEGPAVLPASQLGWTPRVHGKRVQPGPVVKPALSGGPGLAHTAVLGTASRGTTDGPVELDAAVVLETTRDAVPGEYAGVITLTLFPTE